MKKFPCENSHNDLSKTADGIPIREVDVNAYAEQDSAVDRTIFHTTRIPEGNFKKRLSLVSISIFQT